MNIHNVYAPFLKYFRTKRMRQFQGMFNLTADTRILDVGGTVKFWTILSVRPQVTVLNLSVPLMDGLAFSCIVGDGRFLPFGNKTFDLVFSNSVIEHLGTLNDQEIFAREISRVGARFYVQTPNRWFVIEPHLITPLIHFLPKNWQRRLLRNFTVWGLITRPSLQQSDEFIHEVRLLDATEMAQLFPGAEVIKEKFLGLTKSLIAVRM